MEESVSDSELDFNSKVDCQLPRRGTKRWAYAVRRASIGWSPMQGEGSLIHGGDTVTTQPERVVELLRVPSVNTYSTLKRKLIKSKSNPEWTLQFLHRDGLEILFESLEQICQFKPSSFLDTVLQIGCIECIKIIMDSSLGLDYIVENKEFTRKFAAALDTDNVTVKKQVIELLSALCVYSKDGYSCTLDALEHYRVAKKQRYRFAGLLDELRNTENVEYQTNLLEFINCIIIYTEKIQDRVRIRNEFYGLRLQEILNRLRRREDQEQSVLVQLDVFDEHRANDDEQLPGAKGVDLNSPLDVFHSIFKQVGDSPQEINFLTTLQQLLKIDPTDSNSELIWQTVEKLVCKATMIESAEDSQKLLMFSHRKREKSVEGQCTCSCHAGDRSRVTSPRRTSNNVPPQSTSSDMTLPKAAPPPPPPPPPPPGSHNIPPPPPPPPGIPPPPCPPGVPPPPPPPGGIPPPQTQVILPQQNVPKPKTKLRTLQWQKIPASKVVSGKPNIWQTVGKRFNGYVNGMDFNTMEDLFSINSPTPTSTEKVIGGNLSERKKRELTEVNLLEGKRSLNTNISLKQFRMTNDEIIQLLRDGASEKFGAERLRGLMKIMPYPDEIELLRSYDGDKDKLGSAEKFMLCLMELPHYRVRIEGLLIKEEFTNDMEWIRPSIEAVIAAAKDIKGNKELHEILYLVLLAGNYLNGGNRSIGDAAGFKLSSLIKLTDTRANKPRMNLMHYVVMQAEEKNPKCLEFMEEMKFLKDAAQANMENLKTDINNLANKLKNLSDQIRNVNQEFQNQMADFLQESTSEMEDLQEDLKDIESLRLELADFFCEDTKTFKLEEAFKTLQTFCERFKKAIDENKQRKKQEEKVALRMKQKEEERNKKNIADARPTPDSQQNSSTENDDGSIVDMLLADVRSGFANRKFGESNFSVTKVKKVNLDGNDNITNIESKPGFVRGGYGRRSMRSKRKQEEDDYADSESTCSSLEDATEFLRKPTQGINKNDTLMELLTQPDKQTEPPQFERYGSLRRKRQERKENRNLLDVFERERAPSPNVDTVKQNNERSRTPSAEISKTEEFDLTDMPFRRTRSMYDRSTKNKNSNSSENKDKTSESVVDRIKRKLGRKDSPVPDTDVSATQSTPKTNTDDSRSRWRSGITPTDNSHTLPSIEEKVRLVTPTRDLESITEQTDSVKTENTIERSRSQMARRFSNRLDPAELKMLLENADTNGNFKENDSKDDSHKVSVSVKTQLNRRWVSDLDRNSIDQVLKAIEDSESKKENNANDVIAPKATVQAQMSSSGVKLEEANSSGGESESLKARRKMRKQRSNLSLADVKQAINSIKQSENTQEEKPEPGNDKLTSSTPEVPPRRPKSSSEETERISENDSKPKKDTANMSKAAKLAATRKFRHKRFGDKDKSTISDGRWKSDVQKESVDEALKEHGMSRSKSYDESVARKAAGNKEEFALVNLTIVNGEQIKFRRSAGRLDSDGKRGAKYFPSSDSDTEIVPDGTSSPRRPSSSKSDSPKSSSRLSIKSTSTSTETLRCDTPYSEAETSSPEQKRRLSSNQPDVENQVSEQPILPPRTKRNIIVSEKSEFETQAVIQEKHQPLEEMEVSPMALMSKWKQKRSQRRSHYDNVSDHENPISPRFTKTNDNFTFENQSLSSPRSHPGIPIMHKSEGSGDSSIRNEIGSRCSYASSSDSARDEGFETMSGTVSQRTSLSSTLESELTPTFPRKYHNQIKGLQNDDIVPPKQEIIVANVHKQSEIDARKQRTESWTEAVVATTTNINKDTSLDSSNDYSTLSPDSGHGTSKEDVWAENMDLNNTAVRCTSPSSPRSPTNLAPLATPENVETLTAKTKKVPSYMRDTACSSTKSRPGSAGSDTSRRNSTTPSNKTNTSRRSTNLHKSNQSESNTSIASSVSGVTESGGHSKSTSKRKSSFNTPNSRSTTPHPLSRPTTPAHANLSRPTTPASHLTESRSTTPSVNASSSGDKGFLRTQSLRISKPRNSLGSSPADRLKTTSAPSSQKPKASSPRKSFMSPTASSQAHGGEPAPTPPPRTTSSANKPAIKPASVSTAIKPASASTQRTPSRPTNSTLSQQKPKSTKTTPAPKTPNTSSTVKTNTSSAVVNRAKSSDVTKSTNISPLTRHGSLRLPKSSASKLVYHESPVSEKVQSDNKVKSFMSRLAGSKVKPESSKVDNHGALETVTEQTGEDTASSDKSSFIKRIVNKTTTKKSPEKSTDKKTSKK